MLVENIYCYVCVWLCRRTKFHLYWWEHTEQENYERIRFSVIFKMILKKYRIWITEKIWSICNYKINIISHNILHKSLNILTIWSSSERPLCTYTVWYHLLIFSYANPTAHRCIWERLTFLGSFSKHLKPLTSHCSTTKSLSFPLHTH
jgi:hypothetical protein